MDYFAFNGGVTTAPGDGFIGISGEQYQDALEAMAAGQEVTIEGGFAIRAPQPSGHHGWENGQWVDRSPEADVEPLPVPPLTARQLRLGLVTNGFALKQVEAAIAAMEDPQQLAVASIEWEHASQFERNHPLLAQVGVTLGLSDEQIDAMWQHALTL